MHENPRHTRIQRRAGLTCLLLELTLLATASAQKTKGLAFWEPPPTSDAILNQFPKQDDARYATLRKAFADLQCTGSLMQEQPAGKHGEKNLVCTLPGQTANTILVVARYESHASSGWHSSWCDAWMLPLLYHALQAQPRRHTYILAALYGADGEAKFFDQLHDTKQPAPAAMFVVDGLGYGLPLWHTVPSKTTGNGEIAWGANGFLAEMASAVGRVMKIPAPAPLDRLQYSIASDFALAQDWRNERYESTLFKQAGDIPELLIYSDRVPDIDVPAFHKEMDYIAWILCFADVKLDPAPIA
ncbi:MAG: hypothetical protein WA414_11945, partial [Acidobacteriaceae bacterium]